MFVSVRRDGKSRETDHLSCHTEGQGNEAHLWYDSMDAQKMLIMMTPGFSYINDFHSFSLFVSALT